MENIVRWKNMIISFNKVHNSRRCAPCSRDSSYDSWICSVHGIWGSGNQAQWPWTQFCWVYCILVIPSINGDLQWRASRLLTTGASKKHIFFKLNRYPRTYPILRNHKSIVKKNRQNHVNDQAWTQRSRIQVEVWLRRRKLRKVGSNVAIISPFPPF